MCCCLQLLPDKHAKQHCVVVANTRLAGDEAGQDVAALEAGLLMHELQVGNPSSAVSNQDNWHWRRWWAGTVQHCRLTALMRAANGLACRFDEHVKLAGKRDGMRGEAC